MVEACNSKNKRKEKIIANNRHQLQPGDQPILYNQKWQTHRSPWMEENSSGDSDKHGIPLPSHTLDARSCKKLPLIAFNTLK